MRAARRRRLLRQGPDEGRPLRRLHGALRRQERRRGRARRPGCQLQVAYAIGTAHPVSLMIDTFGTEQVDPASSQVNARTLFDFRPAAIIRDLDLRAPALPRDRCLRALRAQGVPVGGDRPRRRPPRPSASSASPHGSSSGAGRRSASTGPILSPRPAVHLRAPRRARRRASAP